MAAKQYDQTCWRPKRFRAHGSCCTGFDVFSLSVHRKKIRSKAVERKSRGAHNSVSSPMADTAVRRLTLNRNVVHVSQLSSALSINYSVR